MKHRKIVVEQLRNTIDGKKVYRVISMVNTTRYDIGQTIREHAVDADIAAGFTVEIKAEKE